VTTSKPNRGSHLRLHAGEHAAENAVDDGACVRRLDTLPDPSVLDAGVLPVADGVLVERFGR
jgi:hypothetical protein